MCPKVPRTYLSQLDLLTHEDEDRCGIGGPHGSVSVGVKPENKAQAELSSSPFHWSLSSLSTTAAGENLTYLAWICVSIYPYPPPAESAILFLYLSNSVCDTQCVRAFSGWIWGTVLLHLFFATAIGWLAVWRTVFPSWSFNLSADPHHS